MGDRDYTAARGDTLWDIAGEQLADPYRWQEIADLNQGRAMSDGRTFQGRKRGMRDHRRLSAVIGIVRR